jgi:putative ABC transport system permease protein
MFGITIKNVFKNKLLYLCLAAGFILSIAIAAAVPTYINSVLDNYIQSIFVEAENKVPPSNKKYIYPSSAYLSLSFRTGVGYDDFDKGYSTLKSMFLSEARKIPLPVQAEKIALNFDSIRYTYSKDNQSFDSINNRLSSISDFDKHVVMVKGRLPEKSISEENTIEVIVDERTMANFSLELDKSYELLHISNKSAPKMKLVGVFQIKDKEDSYWLDKDTNFYCKFMTYEDNLASLFKTYNELGKFLRGVTLELIFDYKAISSKNAMQVYEMGRSFENNFIRRTNSDANFTISDSLKTYAVNEKLYSVMMWIFLIPILLVVMYYIWMISELIVDSDKEQISVLRSRGASQLQILKQYLYEGLLLSSLGLIIGPVLGIALCKGISYSEGFLMFSSAQAIKIGFNGRVYLYAAITVLLLLGTLLTSVFFAAQKSIVEVRHSKNRNLKLLFKSKYMDFILLAVALYGYYNYSINKNVPVLKGVEGNNTPLDPLLYLLSTVFIVAAGMLMLRVYRYIIKFIYELGKGAYSTPFYISIINVMRYHLKKSSAMLFIVITVAIGIFDIHIAKDINESYMNTVKYPTGTDIIVKAQWEKVTYETEDDKKDGQTAGKNPSNPALSTYIEPSYKIFSKLEGVDKYTKVFRDEEGQASLSDYMTNTATIMGIIPHEFGTTAYFDSSLLKTHWYNYLNIMTQKPNTVLVSRAMSTSAGVKPGDTLYYKAKGSLILRGIVQDIVDYWPGLSNLQSKNIVIANFDYIFSKMPVRPYEVWLRKKPEVANEVIYKSMETSNIPIAEYKDLMIETFKAKNDIFLKGTNSVLNLGFLSIGAITILGFLVYWLLSLKGRTLSFGIYRSLGISSKSITLILVLEQLLTLGTSSLIGILAGKLSGEMFIPLIKRLWYENKYVIPAVNLQYAREYIQLGIVFVIVFMASFIVLANYIKRLKINQAIKLGED